MSWSNNHSRLPIGIDIGTRRFKAVQLNATGRQLAAAAMPPRAGAGAIPTSDEVHRLAGVLERGGFAGNRVVLGVPAEKLLTSVLELPRSAGVPMEQLARMELARSHRCAPDVLEMGCWELPAASRAGKSVNVMAVACRHDDATPLLDVFESNGLDVVALDVQPCALARAAELATSDSPAAGGSVTAVLNLSWNTAALVLLYQGTIAYERKVAEWGLQKLHQQFSERLNVEAEVVDYLLLELGLDPAAGGDPMPADALALLTDHVETLAKELSASFAYAGHQYQDAPIGQLLLAGSGAAMPGLDKALGKQFTGITVRRIGPADVLPCAVGHRAAFESPALLTALGLAMFPVGARTMNTSGARAA
jgi:type IV pilus assembly protein PilM